MTIIRNVCPEGDFIVRDNKFIAFLLPLVIGPAWLYFVILLFLLLVFDVPLSVSLDLNKLEVFLFFLVPPILGGYLGGLFAPSKGSGIYLGFKGTFFGATGAILTSIIVLFLDNPYFFSPLDALAVFVLIFIYGLIILISAITAFGGYLGAMTNLRT